VPEIRRETVFSIPPFAKCTRAIYVARADAVRPFKRTTVSRFINIHVRFLRRTGVYGETGVRIYNRIAAIDVRSTVVTQH